MVPTYNCAVRWVGIYHVGIENIVPDDEPRVEEFMRTRLSGSDRCVGGAGPAARPRLRVIYPRGET